MKRLLMPATALAAMKKIAFAILCVTLLMLVAAPAWAQTDQGVCAGALPVGTATGCGALITVTGVDPDTGAATFFTVTSFSQAASGNPYDGLEDTLVGIVNNSGHNLNSITLTSPDITFGGIFGFDADGPCGFGPLGGTHDCFNGASPGVHPGNYQGPNSTFNINSPTSGTVVFSPSISSAPCECVSSTWFALEGTPDSLTSVTQTQPTPPGVTTVFNFGPFNFKSTPAGTTIIPPGNALSITAVPIPPNTEIHFDDGTTGKCAVYDNTGGNCRAFDLQCSPAGSPSCTQAAATYFAEFATSWDTTTNPILRPGFGTNGFPCTDLEHRTFTNVIDFFSQTKTDPTAKGPSGGKPPGGDCWIIATDVTYRNADVSIVKVAPPLVTKGGKLPYGIAVLNLGPATARAVTVTDPVPADTTYQSSAVCFTGSSGVSCLSGTNSPCALSAGVVTCNLGNLLPFSFKTWASIGILLNFTAPASSGTVSNTATVSALNPDPRTDNNSSTANTKVCSAIVKGKCIQ